MTTTTTQPGDIVLAHNKHSFFAKLIRFGQWLRPSWRKLGKDGKPYKYWNHAAIVVSNDNNKIMCVQMGRHGELSPLDNIAVGGDIKILPCPIDVDRDRAVAWAMKQVGEDYSISTIVSIAINLLTPSFFHIDFRRDGQALICSALVARSLEHGGWDCPSYPFDITPAECAIIFE